MKSIRASLSAFLFGSLLLWVSIEAQTVPGLFNAFRITDEESSESFSSIATSMPFTVAFYAHSKTQWQSGIKEMDIFATHFSTFFTLSYDCSQPEASWCRDDDVTYVFYKYGEEAATATDDILTERGISDIFASLIY